MFLAPTELKDLAARGLTMSEIAERLNQPYFRVRKSIQFLGIEVIHDPLNDRKREPKAPKLPKVREPRPDPHRERNARMAAMYRQGLSLAKIGDEFGLTRERVRQLLKKQGITRFDGGQSKSAKAKLGAKQAQRDARYLGKHGVPYATYRQLVAAGATRAYIHQKNSARCRGIAWDLNLAQWWDIWQTSGKWEQRGRGKGKYVMSRIKDEGGYQIGNVHVQLGQDNIRDGLQKYADKKKKNKGVWCLYPGLSKPWLAKYGKVKIGRFATEAEAVEARAAYLAERGIQERGRGWCYMGATNRARPYQVSCRGRYIGYFATQAEAEEAYRAALAGFDTQKVA